MKIPVLINPSFRKLSVLEEAVKEVNHLQTDFELAIIKAEWIADGDVKTSIDSTHMFSEIQKKASQLPVFVVVQRRVNLDMFSDYRPYAYIISTADWETRYAPPPLQTYLVFMIACGLPWLVCSLPTEVADSTLHDPNIGCISDYCSDKKTIKNCMVHAHICEDCKKATVEYGLSDYFRNSVEQILAAVRKSMVGFDATEFSFIVGEKVRLEEGEFIEFKAAQGHNPTGAIKNHADEYAVAMLNAAGGDIFWGIRDEDGVVLGMKLTWNQRDQIRQAVSEKLREIKPPISRFYRLEFYPTHNKERQAISDCWIVRLNVLPGSPLELYATGGDEVFVKTEGGKKRLSHMQVVAEIKRRHNLETGSR